MTNRTTEHDAQGALVKEFPGGWRIRDFAPGEMRPLDVAALGLDDRFWMTAAVPGDVYATLIEHRIIEHPFFGHNDQKSRWVENREWWYRTAFELNADEIADAGKVSAESYRPAPVPQKRARWELVFEGIDTFATVFVNGLEIGSSRNMFAAAVFDVGRILRPGKNTIAVKIDPVSMHNKDKLLFEWSSYTKERPWLRKAAMHFGWDWGPRIATMGIWGAVRLERHRDAKIRGLYCRTTSIGAADAAGTYAASLAVDLDVETFALPQRRDDGPESRFEAQLRLFDRDGVERAFSTIELSQETDGRAQSASGPEDLSRLAGRCVMELAAAHLWWTHDLGEPYLYRLETRLLANGAELDSREEAVGLRTLGLSLEHHGKADFCFVINGVRVFAKGANWIPAEHFFGAARDDRYTQLLELSKDAGMNMLRIWAGGIYEKDVFYRECDRLGLLVWQDCAFANALFPDFNRDFMDSVRDELVYNVGRLRNHASLALWCGNNEIDWLYDMKTAGGDIAGDFYGEAVYHDLVPRVLAALDPDRPYWPSSPWGNQGDQDVNDPAAGDRHNWQVWHGSVYPRPFGEAPVLDYSVQGVSFKNYATDHTLFSSEFGMHASANRYTLETWIPPGEFVWGSAEMAYRNKDTNHRKGILLMEGFTGVPRDIGEYTAFSMLTQAEGLKFGIEHYRRTVCNGALIWQLNDSWPGTSWSMIDYELLPKASYYYARRFFAPLALSLAVDSDGNAALWAVNDRRGPRSGTALVETSTFTGERVFERSFPLRVSAGERKSFARVAADELCGGRDPATVFVRMRFVSDGPDSYESFNYLRDHKDLKLPRTGLSVEADPGSGTVTLRAADALARMVSLDLPRGVLRFSDNFFDLPAGETKIVTVSDLRSPRWSAEERRAVFAGLRVGAING